MNLKRPFWSKIASYLTVIILLTVLCIEHRIYNTTLNNLYDLQKTALTHDYMVMDACVRNLHYSIPHSAYQKIPKSDRSGLMLTFCPECEELKKKLRPEDRTIIPIIEERYQELLMKERELQSIKNSR
jgi:hypothetical protein